MPLCGKKFCNPSPTTGFILHKCQHACTATYMHNNTYAWGSVNMKALQHEFMLDWIHAFIYGGFNKSHENAIVSTIYFSMCWGCGLSVLWIQIEVGAWRWSVDRHTRRCEHHRWRVCSLLKSWCAVGLRGCNSTLQRSRRADIIEKYSILSWKKQCTPHKMWQYKFINPILHLLPL